MRRFLLVGAILGVAAAAAGASTPSVLLRSFVCRRALDPTQRVVSVTAVMGTLAGTQRLQVRFQLMRRSAGTVATVHGGDLGRWVSPNPPTLGQHPNDVWIVRHPVTGVPVPGSYRFRVSFRWIGAGGRILSEQQLTGNSCREPDMRPDLQVRSITVQPIAGDAAHDQYVAEIGNAGLSAASAVAVLFAPGGGGQTQTITVQRLRPHTTVVESFTGPACTSAVAPTITVDPGNRVNDLNRGNNSLTATCPG